MIGVILFARMSLRHRTTRRPSAERLVERMHGGYSCSRDDADSYGIHLVVWPEGIA